MTRQCLVGGGHEVLIIRFITQSSSQLSRSRAQIKLISLPVWVSFKRFCKIVQCLSCSDCLTVKLTVIGYQTRIVNSDLWDNTILALLLFCGAVPARLSSYFVVQYQLDSLLTLWFSTILALLSPVVPARFSSCLVLEGQPGSSLIESLRGKVTSLNLLKVLILLPEP